MKAKTLSLHIRAVGHWTNSLYQYFEKEQAKLEGTNVPVDKRSRSVLRLFPHISPFFFQAARNNQPGKGPST